MIVTKQELTMYSYFIQTVLHLLITGLLITGGYFVEDKIGLELTIFLVIFIGIILNIALFRAYYFNRYNDKEGGTVSDPRRN